MKWREQLATSDHAQAPDPRPAVYFEPFHRRARERDPDATYEALRVVSMLWVRVALRTSVVGADCVPSHGAVIVVSNHGSFLDNFILGSFVHRRLHFMAKSQMFQFPSHWIYSHAGAFPVRRGLQDEEALITGRAILARGGALVVYPAGTRSSHPMEVSPKAGVGRLALESGVPIVPMAIHGSNRVRYWSRGEIPKVTVVRGLPLQWRTASESDRENATAVAEAIYREIEQLYRSVA